MEANIKTNSKTHTGANFTNKNLVIEKVLKKQDILKWLALFGAFLFQAIPYGVSSNILGNMQPFVVNGVVGEYPGIFNGFVLFTLVFTFGSIFSAIFTPLIGKLFGRTNLKLLLGIGCVVSGGAFAMLSLLGVLFDYGQNNESLYAQRAAWLYSWYGICLVGTSIFSGLGVPFIIGSWFPGKNRGIVLGIAFAGGSAGNLIWQVAINQTLKTVSVWDAFWIYGLVAIVAGLLISCLLINSPKVFRINSNSQTLNQVPQLTKEQDIAQNGAGIKTTLSIPWFYVLCLSYGIFALGTAAASSQWPTFLRSGLINVAQKFSNGDSIQVYLGNTATIIGLIYGVACLAGNLTGGIIFSKLGVAKAFVIGGVLRSIGAIAMLLGVFNPMLLAIGVGISGFTCYTYTSATGFMSTNLFGRKDSPVVIGLLGLAFAVGFAISTPLISGIQGNPETVTNIIAGETIKGNWLGIWVFTAVIALLGALAVAASAAKIHKMGFTGMANANYSRYGLLVAKYGLPIYFKSLKIWLSGKDSRLTTTYLKLISTKEKEWINTKSNKYIELENKKFLLNKNKINAKTKLLNNKANLKLNKIKDEISELKISSKEQEKINIKIKMLNSKISKYNGLISNKYNELIDKLVSYNNEYNNKEIDDLINRLKMNETMLESDYDNKFVIEYLVKYATAIMNIQKLEAKINIATNPRLYKLEQNLKQVNRKIAIIAFNDTYKNNRNEKNNAQIIDFYKNKYTRINQMIDTKILFFKTNSENRRLNAIQIEQEKINKNKNKIQKINSRYNSIDTTWDNSAIHKSLTTDSMLASQENNID